MSEASLEALRRATVERPRDAAAWLALAEALFERGRDAEVVVAVETALRLAVPPPAAYRLLGEAHARLGNGKEARWAFRHAVEAARGAGDDTLADRLERRREELGL